MTRSQRHRLAVGWLAAGVFALACAPGGAEDAFKPRTRLSIKDGFWWVNGAITYPDSTAEGLLLGVRATHALFDDRNPASRPKDFDAEANTRRFIDAIPKYRDSGVNAFLLSLQGTDPGYPGSICSAFLPDGSLDAAYMKRAARAIEACDAAGALVVLVLFTRFQDKVLENDAAAEKGVKQAMGWLRQRGYANVLVEVADEYAHEGYHHQVFKNPAALAKLMEIAKEAAPGAPVSAIGLGSGRIDPQVGSASTYVSTRFSSVRVNMISARLAKLHNYGKPILCAADEREVEGSAEAVDACVRSLGSYTVSLAVNERHPFRFGGPADAPELYGKIRELSAK
jgi:hypothetical protein